MMSGLERTPAASCGHIFANAAFRMIVLLMGFTSGLRGCPPFRRGRRSPPAVEVGQLAQGRLSGWRVEDGFATVKISVSGLERRLCGFAALSASDSQYPIGCALLKRWAVHWPWPRTGDFTHSLRRCPRCPPVQTAGPTCAALPNCRRFEHGPKPFRPNLPVRGGLSVGMPPAVSVTSPSLVVARRNGISSQWAARGLSQSCRPS